MSDNNIVPRKGSSNIGKKSRRLKGLPFAYVMLTDRRVLSRRWGTTENCGGVDCHIGRELSAHAHCTAATKFLDRHERIYLRLGRTYRQHQGDRRAQFGVIINAT